MCREADAQPFANRRKSRGHTAHTLIALLTGILIYLSGAPPLHAAANLALARQLASDGQLEQALQQVDEVLRLQPQNIPARLLRVALLNDNGHSDAAIDELLSIARDRPDLPEPYNNLAVLYAAQGRYDDARAALQQAIELQPDYDVAYENLGDVYMKLASLAYTRAKRNKAGNERAARKVTAIEQILHSAQPHTSTGAQQTSAIAPSVPDPPQLKAASTATLALSSAALPPPATTVTAPLPATIVAQSCVQIPVITPASRAQQVAQWLLAHGMQAVVTDTNTGTAAVRGYRVVLPVKGDLAQARAQVKKLRAQGVTDLIIIPSGGNENGISLGVFSKRAGAERRQRALASRGIKAQIIERNAPGRIDSAAIEARGPFIAAEFTTTFNDLPFDIDDCR